MTQHNFELVNGDTDSIAFKKPDETPFTVEEQDALLAEINALLPEKIRFENDKHFKRFIVLKAKHYILDDGKKIKIKGGGLKAPKKPKALKSFIMQYVDELVKGRKDHLMHIYWTMAQQILDIKDITDWCFRVTVTKKVLHPSEKAAFQHKIKAAIGSTPVSEGDKIYFFYNEDESLSIREAFKGEYSKDRLLGSLKDTLKVFDQIMDTDLFPDFTLQRNREMLGLETNKKPKATPKLAVIAPLVPQTVPVKAEPEAKQSAFPEGFWIVN